MTIDEKLLKSEKPTKPWLSDSNTIEIINAYEAIVINKDEKYFYFEIETDDGEDVESAIDREKFKDFPYKLEEKLPFLIIIYQTKSDSKEYASPWPITHYWNKDLVSSI